MIDEIMKTIACLYRKEKGERGNHMIKIGIPITRKKNTNP